jgi:hypothetical protein
MWRKLPDWGNGGGVSTFTTKSVSFVTIVASAV